MSSTSRRNSKSERQSIFFHDLASPVSVHRAGGRLTTPGQLAVVSALWKENFGGSEPPPPPVFTLEDRVDFSPEPALGEFPTSPEIGSDSRTPKPSHGYLSSSPHRGRGEASSSVLVNGGLLAAKQQHQHSPGSASWWSPVKAGEPEKEENGRGSPVDGVVQPGALIMLPSSREAVRPEMLRNNLHMGALDEEEWVTVYGFAPGDTNLVLREFDKCGTILKHVPGPRDANWMHILYQNHYDAQRALGKNGAQINSVLIIGVKPVDYSQRQYLDERLNSSNHANLLLPYFSPRTTYGRSTSSSLASSGVGVTARPNAHLNGGGASATDGKGQRSVTARPNAHLNGGGASATDGKGQRSAIASPAKSVVSKVMDLMFGI